MLISAVMLLPSYVLRGLLPAQLLLAMEARAGALSWALADVAHAVAFVCLSMVLWLLHGWRAVTVLVVLAVAAKLMQGLTVKRAPRIDDVVINLAGAAGLLLLACCYRR